jgi:hypothetical protein
MRTLTNRLVITLAAFAVFSLSKPTPTFAQSYLFHADDYIESGTWVYSGNGDYALIFSYGWNPNLSAYSELLVYLFTGVGQSYGVWNSRDDGSRGGIHADQWGVVDQDEGFAVMQGDGNFVLYDGPAAWATNTWYPGGTAYLNLQDDGNMVVYDAYDNVLWSLNYSW